MTENRIELRRIALGSREHRDFDGAHSCVYTGAGALWPELCAWTPGYLAARCDGSRHSAYVSVPSDPVPYKYPAVGMVTSMCVAEIVERMERGEMVYGPALQTKLLERLDLERRFMRLALGALDRPADGGNPGESRWSEPSYVTLWLGNHSRSGLHYDTYDNLLLQVYGTKKATVVSSEHSGAVYPYGDAVSKSRVNVEAPDYGRFPRFRGVTVEHALLEPGDVLFLRKGDWHYLASDGSAVSINCWFGSMLPISERARRVNAANPFLWAHITRDFLWHGLMRRPFAQRLACPKPTGAELYELVASRIADRSKRAAAALATRLHIAR